jgi:hypothetical protein
MLERQFEGAKARMEATYLSLTKNVEDLPRYSTFVLSYFLFRYWAEKEAAFYSLYARPVEVSLCS